MQAHFSRPVESKEFLPVSSTTGKSFYLYPLLPERVSTCILYYRKEFLPVSSTTGSAGAGITSQVSKSRSLIIKYLHLCVHAKIFRLCRILGVATVTLRFYLSNTFIFFVIFYMHLNVRACNLWIANSSLSIP